MNLQHRLGVIGALVLWLAVILLVTIANLLP